MEAQVWTLQSGAYELPNALSLVVVMADKVVMGTCIIKCTLNFWLVGGYSRNWVPPGAV
jgi:hypothetical protein